MDEKVQLNNEILKLRKSIHQGKVHVINKLVKKLRKLKKQTETESVPEKLTGKEEKIVQQIEYLKNVKDLHLAKLSLILDKDPQKILTNSQSTIEQQSLAYVCQIKSVEREVQRIKLSFNLNEESDTWRATIEKIGTNKSKKKKVKRTTDNSGKQLIVKEEEKKISDKSQSIELRNEPIPIKKSPKIKEKPTVKFIEEDIPIEPLKTVVDSFFVTETGENYRSTAVVDRVQPAAPNDGLVRRERRAQKNNENSSRRTVTKKGTSVPFNSKQKRSINDNSKQIHPSWVAKQQQKGIKNFQGSRIKFDLDVGESVKQEKSVNGGKNLTEQMQEVEKKLHPSWVAKQKQKPIITGFQGTKIKFDDE